MDFCQCEDRTFKDTYTSQMGYHCCVRCFKIIECCINCKSNITLYKHPWNTQFKGRIIEETGLSACIVDHDIDGSRKGIISEFGNSLCELFTLNKK